MDDHEQKIYHGGPFGNEVLDMMWHLDYLLGGDVDLRWRSSSVLGDFTGHNSLKKTLAVIKSRCSRWTRICQGMALRQYLFLAGKGVSRQSTTSSHASAEAVLFFFSQIWLKWSQITNHVGSSIPQTSNSLNSCRGPIPDYGNQSPIVL